VQNALHYNESGGSVLVTVGEHPALMVSNTGPVVPAEALPSLFAPFSRGPDRERMAGRNGAGLGLSIVRSVAQAHHGMVYAEPNYGGGLRIVLGFPLERNVTSLSLRSGADPAINRG
jgi:signal transduction histidine kinase